MKVKVQSKQDEYGYRDYPYDEFDGFTKLAEIEWANHSYEFDLTGVWTRNSDGTLWYAHDSGCSCPSPWDRVDELERLFSLEPLEERRKNSPTDDWGGLIPQEWEAFKATVEKAFADLAAR